MITIEHKKYNKIEEINVKGHAGYAPIGKDIICSAVSSVVYTLKIALEKADENKKALLLKCELNEGKALIVFEPLSAETKAVVNALIDGLKALSDSYPDYIGFLPCGA